MIRSRLIPCFSSAITVSSVILFFNLFIKNLKRATYDFFLSARKKSFFAFAYPDVFFVKRRTLVIDTQRLSVLYQQRFYLLKHYVVVSDYAEFLPLRRNVIFLTL